MNITSQSVARGILAAIGSFLLLGTVTALWPNPFFVRMTPTSSFEVAFLAAQSMLLGVYLAIPVTGCAVKLAGTGGVANFLGVACPICNKVLVLLFGAQALLTYLEPARIYLAAGGALLTGIAVVFRWRRFQAAQAGSIVAAQVRS
ncbi:MAG TPA: hypothetical protein VF814_15450 [Casimicrobiaceae bacterium]